MARSFAASSGTAEGGRLDVAPLRAAMAASTAPLADGAVVTPVDAGGVRAEWITTPGAAEDRRLLYLHGGGYAGGGLESHRAPASWIAAASGVVVLHIDYRLAPEDPHPAALDDALAAYRFMRANGPVGRAEAASTFIGGDSAGGGLTLASLVALRDRDEPLPTAAVTLSAWTDLAATGDSVATRAGVDPMMSPGILAGMAKHYAGDLDPRSPLISPLYAGLAGLPPLLMQVGDSEVLLDDTTRVAEKAEAAGVEVTLEVWPEMFHVFQAFAPAFPEGREAIEHIGAFLKRHAG